MSSKLAMATLVLVLAAAMAVPGNGPEMVSAEMEQGLDLRGKWDVSYFYSDGTSEVWHDTDGLFLMEAYGIQDEGKGRLQMMPLVSLAYPGIYRQEHDHIAMCFRVPGEGQPTDFSVDEGQIVLILRRVKPRK